MSVRRLSLAPLALALSAALGLAAGPVWAQTAVGGMDVVSLRDSGRAIAGDDAISTHWRGREWSFANEANRATFESNPSAYAPGFGGNCPVALSEGARRPGLPDFPVVIGGRLYLTSSGAAQSAMRADPDAILGRAATAWANLKN
ncbi:YHS domain-containing (seleno)protein [Paracoccus sanguinis]|uniref:YHS domain-containing protein n=1 Tax=Paracoccus sanguinis TaxID=1545044 RepID=A0A1H2R3S8_9RHOB|nr:YHS domain-containing (seleno)protein [Paracoccus sanguinis]SDW13349.1 hypothetical protein SAMN05444276_101195 [Paracoccus sanguinis]